MIPIRRDDVVVLSHQRTASHRHGLLADVEVEKTADLFCLVCPQAPFLEVTQHEREAVPVAKIQKPFIEDGHQCFERRCALPLERGNFTGCLLAPSPPQLRPDASPGFENRGPVQPPTQRPHARETWRLSGEHDEYILRDLLGQSRVPDLPERRGINQVDVPRHQRAKGGFRAARGVVGHEFAIR